MSAPFSNGTEGDLFMSNRCQRCAHWDDDLDLSCDDFTPAFFGEWPEILYRVPRSQQNPLGVECRNFLKVAAS